MDDFKFIIKQFPYIFPKYFIQSTRDFVDSKIRGLCWYNSTRSDWYLTVEKHEFKSFNCPRSIQRDYKFRFCDNISRRTYDCTLFYLKDIYIFGNEGFILTNYFGVFLEFIHFFNSKSVRKKIFLSPFMFFTRSFLRKDATGAVLLSPQSHNYYHWFFDVIARIRLYEPVFDQIDFFCISEEVPNSFLAVLPYFGVEEHKILRVKSKDKIRFKNTYVSSLPGSEGRTGQWAVDYIYKKLVFEYPRIANGKYYLRRGTVNQRRIINEIEIVSYLESIGFEILDMGKMTIKEQVRKMHDATLVIGLHGAALTNLTFAPNGCRVVEIHTEDYFRTDCFYELAELRNLQYWYIVGEKAQNGKWGEINLCVNILKQTIQRLQ